MVSLKHGGTVPLPNQVLPGRELRNKRSSRGEALGGNFKKCLSDVKFSKPAIS